MKVLGVVLLFVAVVTLAPAQDTVRHDPLLGNHVLANCAELVAFSERNLLEPQLVLSQELFGFYRTPGFFPNDTIQYHDSAGLSAALRWDCVAGDFTGDERDEIAAAWAGPDNTLSLSITGADRAHPFEGNFSWSEPRIFRSHTDTINGPVRLVAANLDWSPREEIVALYAAPDGMLHFSVFDSLDPVTQAPVRSQNQVLDFTLNYTAGDYDLTAGDFDDDGLDEVLVVLHEVLSGSHSLTGVLLDYLPGARWLHIVWTAAWSTPASGWNNWKRLKVTAGDFRHRGYDDAVISMTIASGNSGNQSFMYATMDPDNLQFNFQSPPGSIPPGSVAGNGWESDAFAADMNLLKSDGDELVVAGPGEIGVVKFTVGLAPYFVARVPFDQPGVLEQKERRRFVAVADVNAIDSTGGSWLSEVVVAEHRADLTTVMRCLTPVMTPGGDITGLTELSRQSLGHTSSRCEIVMGDLDGDAVLVRNPKFIRKESFYQPVIQLNVPPTHFDVIDGDTVDVCKAYGPSPSEFKATYVESHSQSSHFESALGQSWGLSAEMSGGFSFFDIDVKTRLNFAYKDGSYGSIATDTSTTASQVTWSTGDDWMLATLADYDLWEFELYAAGTFRGHVLAQIPHYRDTKWFAAKSVNGRNLSADHEVGNLLSYMTKEALAEKVGERLIASFRGQTISSNSGGTWELDLASQGVNESKLTRDIGVEVGASIDAWGFEANVAGTYNSEEVVTHTSTATDSMSVVLDISGTDATMADVDYEVTPFIYWGDNGALMIDYAVDLPQSGVPGLETFWELKYKVNADPAFILPWRLDAEKGVGVNPAMAHYCKSLRVSPASPAGGETARISAIVYNFSLKETAIPVKVMFYLGNPDEGGMPIVGTLGEQFAVTNAPIPAQGHKTVVMNWNVPFGLDNTAKLYAVIDPYHEVVEIHAENNVGFIPISGSGVTDVPDDGEELIPVVHALGQNYPNPFNPTTVIGYSLFVRGPVTLRVYDILGREVAILVDGVKAPGTFTARWDASGLPGGVYFYRLTGPGVNETRKMVLIR
jgi:hypothetical protein